MGQRNQTTITITEAAKAELDEDREAGVTWEGYLLSLKRGAEEDGDIERLEEKIDKLDGKVAEAVVNEMGGSRY